MIYFLGRGPASFTIPRPSTPTAPCRLVTEILNTPLEITARTLTSFCPPVFVQRAYKKLSCRRETVRCFVSLNISISNSRSLKVIETGTIRKLGYGFLCDSILYYFRDKPRYLSKIAIFSYPFIFDAPLGGFCGNIAIPFGRPTQKPEWCRCRTVKKV